MSDLTEKYQKGKWFPGRRTRNERAIKSAIDVNHYLVAYESGDTKTMKAMLSGAQDIRTPGTRDDAFYRP